MFKLIIIINAVLLHQVISIGISSFSFEGLVSKDGPLLNPDLDIEKAKQMVVKFAGGKNPYSFAHVNIDENKRKQFPKNGKDLTGQIN